MDGILVPSKRKGKGENEGWNEERINENNFENIKRKGKKGRKERKNYDSCKQCLDYVLSVYNCVIQGRYQD